MTSPSGQPEEGLDDSEGVEEGEAGTVLNEAPQNAEVIILSPPGSALRVMRSLIPYHSHPIFRVFVETRFIANTLKEALLHPLSTSVIDKRTGRLISRD